MLSYEKRGYYSLPFALATM